MNVIGPTGIQILQAIRSANGHPPSVRELMQMVGCQSPYTIQKQVDKLVRWGLVTREPGRSRTLRAVPLRVVKLEGR